MTVSARSIVMGGIAAVTASVVAIAPSVQPLPPPRPTIQLAADAQLLALQEQPPLLTVLLHSPLALLGPAAPLGTLPPAPAPLAIPIAPNLADTIDSIYLAVEPWVQYGFEVATAVIRWIPYAGWFAGLIMDGYFFGESLVASGVFNFTDWLRGDGGIVENLVDFGVDVGLAFVWLGLDALNTFIPLPPFCCYPPRPPVQGPFLAANTLLGPTAAPVQVANADGLRGFLDRVLNPLDAGGAIQGDASLGSLVKNGLANLGDLLGVAVSPQDPETTSDISTVPSIVKTPFAPLNSLRSQVDPASETGAGPLTELRETVRNARNVIREATGRGAVDTLKAGDDAKTVGNEVVRTQGGVRGAATEAVSDVTNALRPNKPSKSADGATTTSTNVVKSFGDTAKKVVKQVREAAKDARDAVKNRPASDADE